MTLERQEANRIATKPHFRPRTALIALAVVAGLGGVVAAGPIALAATTERVVINRYSGLAIEGYDPLAYFIDGNPAIGLPAYEAAQGGVVWRFRNEGNRDCFVAHPEIYGPQFGGYAPVDVARGVTVAGSPRFWLISGRRLYLFGREQTRDDFSADAARLLQEASPRWPALQQELNRIL